MDEKEAIKYLFDKAMSDVGDLQNCIDEYRKDKGIALGQFIEILGMVVQNYRLFHSLNKSRSDK